MFSLGDLRQDLLIEREVGDGLAQPPVLILELPHAFDFVVAHAPELLPPASEGLCADLQLLADLRHGIAPRGQLIGLTQLPDDLVGRVPLAFHRADLSGVLFAPKISLAVGWSFQAGSRAVLGREVDLKTSPMISRWNLERVVRA